MKGHPAFSTGKPGFIDHRNQTRPVNPVAPVNPVDPVAPVKPVSPVKPVKPAQDHTFDETASVKQVLLCFSTSY